MPDLTAKRTLVKSPPELWEELSEVEGLMKHLGAFGEIKITKLEPEHTVAWEGEHGSGTVSIEPSGWGTKVTFHAELPETAEPEPVAVEPEPESFEPEPAASEPAPEPIVESSEPPRRRRGFFGWLFKTRTAAIPTEPEPVPVEPEPVAIEPEPAQVTIETDAVVPEPEPEPDPESQPKLDDGLDPERARVVLDEALDALGAAHHRPFSRG
jgi:hypothetical protein